MAPPSRCTALPRSRIGSRPGWWSPASRRPASGRSCPGRSDPWRPAAARFGFDWLSLTTTSTGTVALPTLMPALVGFLEIGDDEVVGFGERGERTGLRADIAELYRARLRDHGRSHPRQRGARRGGGFRQRAAINRMIWSRDLCHGALCASSHTGCAGFASGD